MKSSLLNLSRIPALRNRITRASHAENLQKISYLKSKLGDRYSQIGRDKRFSPTTLKRSSTLASQKPIPNPPVKIKDFLIDSENTLPPSIVPGDITETLKNSIKKQELKSLGANKGIRMDKSIKKADKSKSKYDLKADVIPKVIKKSGTFDPIITTSSQGPYYAFGIDPTQVDFILNKTRKATAIKNQDNSSDAQAESVRRIISLENGNGTLFKKFNRQRIVELLGNEPFDTGSSQVQAGMFTLRIQRFKEHLEKNPKDNSMKRQLEIYTWKRIKILKHLRKKNLQLFVKTCDLLGVEPDSIVATK